MWVIVLDLRDEDREMIVIGPFPDVGDAFVYVRNIGRFGDERAQVREVTPPAAPENN